MEISTTQAKGYHWLCSSLSDWEVVSLICTSHLPSWEQPQQLELVTQFLLWAEAFVVCIFGPFLSILTGKQQFQMINTYQVICIIYLLYLTQSCQQQNPLLKNTWLLCRPLGVYRENAGPPASVGDLKVVWVWVWDGIHLQKDPPETCFRTRQTGVQTPKVVFSVLSV